MTKYDPDMKYEVSVRYCGRAVGGTYDRDYGTFRSVDVKVYADDEDGAEAKATAFVRSHSSDAHDIEVVGIMELW